MYHAFFLLILGSISVIKEKAKSYILILVSIGVVFFSFSIYALATNTLSGFDFKAIAFITPIGGLLLILAWVILLINILKTRVD